jgi:hypothetical protein
MSDDYVKGRWEDVETMELVSQIRCWLHHHTNGATSTLVDFAELAQLVDELKIQIPWSLISKRMGRRSRLACFKKWQKLTGEAEMRAAFRARSAEASSGTATAATTTTTSMVGTTTAAMLAEQHQHRPSKRQKTEVNEECEPEDEEEAAIPTDYSVPTTEAHNNNNNMVVTADEAELAAETVEALGLPDLIVAKKTMTTTTNEKSRASK